jgi:hypothetical protein
MGSSQLPTIDVKVGRHIVTVTLNKDSTSQDIISNVFQLINKNIFGDNSAQFSSSSFNKYVLLERAHGIDRMIESDENIFKIWLKFSLLSNGQHVKFIIKSLKRVAQLKRIIEMNNRKTHRIFKLYRSEQTKGSIKIASQVEPSYDVEEYEDIDQVISKMELQFTNNSKQKQPIVTEIKRQHLPNVLRKMKQIYNEIQTPQNAKNLEWSFV